MWIRDWHIEAKAEFSSSVYRFSKSIRKSEMKVEGKGEKKVNIACVQILYL